MKKYIIYFFVISCLSLYSQDFEPTQQQFIINRIGVYMSADSAYFKQNNFILGWAWGYGRKMSEAMLDNQAHVGSGSVYQKSWIKNNTNLIINTNDVWDNGSGNAAMNSQSLVYSPVLHITNPETQTNIRLGDPKHSIFGFNFNFLISALVVISDGVTPDSGISTLNKHFINNF